MRSGDVFALRFEIEKLAGVGGMGEVYRARDRTSGGLVALKVLRDRDPKHEGRLGREARVLAELRHPAIVGFVDHGVTTDGDVYLAMEWLDGEDLKDHLAPDLRLSPRDAVLLGKRIAGALAAAHAIGIVHRDIKPSNVLVPRGAVGEARLLDFGIVRIADATVATATGLMVGTPGYMSPEQARGQSAVDARADVFSLGCLLYRCLSGEPPFAGEHLLAVLAKLVFEEAEPLAERAPDAPLELIALVERMMKKEPAERPADGAAVLEALTAIEERSGAGGGGATLRGAVLTESEQRVVTVVIASEAGAGDRAEMAAPASFSWARLEAQVLPFGARVERLADGSYVATIAGTGEATDQAGRAARCALAMKALLPDRLFAIATGRGVVGERGAVGEAIDRAVAIVRGRTANRLGAVRLDDTTAGLLVSRFAIERDESAPVAPGPDGARAPLAGMHVLISERTTVDAGHTLLGRRMPCVGRDRELHTLRELFAECVEEPMARAVLVTAASGVGKSRLRHEFLRGLGENRDGDAAIWIARGDPMSAGSPFVMLADLVRRVASAVDGEPAEMRRQKLAARVARHVPEAECEQVTEFLAWLIGVSGSESVELKSARADPQLMCDQLGRAFERFLAAETVAHPVVVVLEDFQWGDQPTAKLLDATLDKLREQPFFMLALARPEVAELFPKLWANRGVQEIRLPGLTPKSAERLVRDALGPDATAETVRRLVERASGNAFFLEELVRAVADGSGEALPETVLAVVQVRLEALGSEARRLLRAASVFGGVFWSGAVAALVGERGDAIATREGLDHLEASELLVRRRASRFSGQEEFAFRHALVREAAYAMLVDEDRALAHRLAGGWLERAGENDAMVLGEHFERGGGVVRARTAYARAAEQALAANDLTAAIARAERCVALGAAAELLGRARLVEAEARTWRGEPKEAMPRAVEALSLLPEGAARWFQAAAISIETCGIASRFEEQMRFVERLLVAEPDAEAHVASVIALTRAGEQMLQAGKPEVAASLYAMVDRTALDEDEPAAIARVHHARASRAKFAGDVAGYLEHSERQAEAIARTGDLRRVAMQRISIGFAKILLGANEEAETDLTTALASTERMGLPNLSAVARQNLGLAFARQGAFAQGAATLREAIGFFVSRGDRHWEAGTRRYLAEALALGGDLDGALREARTAAELMEPKPPSQAAALAWVAELERRAGNVNGALVAARRAMEILESLGGLNECEALARLVWAEALLATGRVEEGKRALDAARVRLLERAAKVTDPARRASFLSAIPENAWTMARASAVLEGTHP